MAEEQNKRLREREKEREEVERAVREWMKWIATIFHTDTSLREYIYTQS